MFKRTAKSGPMNDSGRPLGESEPAAPRGVGGVEPDGPAINGSEREAVGTAPAMDDQGRAKR